MLKHCQDAHECFSKSILGLVMEHLLSGWGFFGSHHFIGGFGGVGAGSHSGGGAGVVVVWVASVIFV